MSDLALRDDILDELAYEPVVDASHIGVAVDQGVVTLTGHVGTYAQKLAAVSAVRRVKGVRGIADEIDVRSFGFEKITDDEIAQRGIEVLKWDSVVPAEDIQVTVRDGWVTLTGEVNWHYQRASAEEDVRKLAGVRGINNEITIKVRANAEEIKRKIELALKRHTDAEAEAIKVVVHDDGEVVLEGKVDNWSERTAVESAAWAAPGVKTVKDHLAIAS